MFSSIIARARGAGKPFLLGFVLVLGLLAAASGTAMLSVSAQGVPGAEICNGKDDNGDGQTDEGVNCDHYLTYLINKATHPISVVLRDQFIDPTDFQLVALERLLNPVRKVHDNMAFDPKRPELHYLAYRLQTPAPFTPRTVLIENQFEKRSVSVTKPRYLLTPTGKRKAGIPIEEILNKLRLARAEKWIAAIIPPIPEDANHYLCYDVEPYDIKQGVAIRDQFQKRPFELLRARYLCNPAQKTHDGKVSEIVDANNHLMCYEVLPHNRVHRKFIAHDQFGIKSQTTIQTEEFCVPTIKTHLEACVRPDDRGTAVLFDADTAYHTQSPLVIIPPSPASSGLAADGMLQSTPATVISRSGSPAAGETYTFETEMLQLSLSGGHILNIPVSGAMESSPRMPGDPVQSFDTQMLRLQGQLPPGDPDFDLLRITAGNEFGMPSPGHTTLTQLPDGSWNVDSFFDITYRIDFVGAPGGPWAGQQGSHQGTARLQGPCPEHHQ